MSLYLDEFRSVDALHDLNYSSQLDTESFHALVLAATGDARLADRLAAVRAESRLAANLPM